jgi:hypothetical protein
MDGYELVRADYPSDSSHGGVCVFFKQHLPLKLRTDLSNLNECLVCEVKINNQKCFVTCVYRSPSQSFNELNDFCNALEETLSNLNLESPFCSVILGDFNGKCNNWWMGNSSDSCGLELESLSTRTGYSQLISEPTNFEPNKRPSCIDLLFCDQPNLITESGVHSSLYNTCHHQIIFAKIDFRVYLPPPYKREIWEYHKANVDLIKRSIADFDWQRAFLNLGANDQVQLFTSTLLNIFRNFIPNKIVKYSYKDPPWITSELKTMQRKKNRMYRKYIVNGRKEDDKVSLDNFSLSYSNKVSSSKQIHFDNLGRKLDDPLLGPKAFWTILNGFLGKMKIPTIPPSW